MQSIVLSTKVLYYYNITVQGCNGKIFQRYIEISFPNFRKDYVQLKRKMQQNIIHLFKLSFRHSKKCSVEKGSFFKKD